MAETWTRSFGRYLRSLRERRGLSLEEVRSLSQTFADTLNKGYLSRCENGHQRIAFSKVIPLSRIYDVPADALLERLELDMELDRVGAPSTEGMDFSELTEAGTKALNQGYRWHAYGYLRDATPRAPVDPVRAAFRDSAEQVACAQMSCATGAKGLGRFRFALHEYLFVKDSGAIGPRFHPILLERLAQVYRHTKELALGREYADAAVAAGEALGDKDYLGFVYGNRGNQALADSDWVLAAEFFRKAYRTYRESNRVPESAASLTNLANAYFRQGRIRAARRALLAADALMQPLQLHSFMAVNFMLMGEIDASNNEDARAVERWRQAASIAKRLDDKVLRFQAEFLLLKQAYRDENWPVARSIQRRLKRISNWIPKSVQELEDFKKLTAEAHV